MHAIETRAYRLSPRMRNALILADGKRDVGALQALMAQPLDGTLDMLLEQVFIEVAGDRAAAPARASDEARGQGRAASVACPPPGAASAPAPPFALRQRAAVRELIDAVGPLAEPLAIRMERAPHDADLRPLVQAAVQLIGNTRGRSAAYAYARRHAS